MSSHRSTTHRTIQAYASFSEVYLKEWHRRTYRAPPLLKDWIGHLQKNAQLLDLGCGPAQDSRYLRRQGYRVVGIDLTQSFLQAARERGRTLPLVLANIEQLPFHPHSFEGIWAAASLIHIPKTRLCRVLQQLSQVTRSGGFLAATLIHGKGSGFLPDQWIRGRFLSKWHKRELKRIVEKAGWEVQYLQTVLNQERDGRWLNLIGKRNE